MRRPLSLTVDCRIVPESTKLSLARCYDAGMDKMHVQLSRTLSHALRHAPWEYELELDDAGWVPVGAIIAALRDERPDWRNLQETDLTAVVEGGDKRRFEMTDGRIRALYGHSVPQRLAKERAIPPAVLYHGTTATAAEAILRDGLKPMARQYVHLSVDTETASQVAARWRGQTVILTVHAAEASTAGHPFYRGNDRVWLADGVLPAYLSLLEQGETAG